MYTAPYEVDIIVTSILLVGTLRPREIQEQALISKSRNLDLSAGSSCTHTDSQRDADT